VDKARLAAPSILLLDHIEALAKRSEASATGKSPLIVKIINDLLKDMRTSAAEIGWPIVLMGTTVDEELVPADLLSCFKQDISIAVRLCHSHFGRIVLIPRHPMKKRDCR
jgi:peroxin-6